jgi:general secretion pathway protein D
MRLSEIIKGLDKITPQVMIEARIIEATLGTADKLGIDWTMRVAASGSVRPTTFPFTEQVKGSGSKWFPKVKVPSELQRVTTTVYDDAGNPISSTTEEKTWHKLVPGFPSVPAGNFLFGTLDFSQLRAVLEILKSSSDTKIISNPHITTLNNQEAKILVGTKVPIPIYQFSTETGTRVISGYEEEKVGVGLTVIPSVNEKDYITLALKPTVEEITGWTGPDNERPIIATRSAETKVMIKNDQTLVMGGLISEKKIKARRKVPILGNIPVLDFLFSWKSDILDKTELLIFITPHIITEGMSSPEEIAELEEGLGKDKKESTIIKKK